MQSKANAKPRRIKVKGRQGIYYRELESRKRRYEIGYLDSDKKQRWETIDGNLEAAQAKRDAIIARMRGGEIVSPSDLRVGDLLDTWLKEQTGVIRDSTVGRYEVDIRLRLKPLLGDTRVTDLTVDDVARLISRMRDDGYAAWTVRAALTPLRGAFKWAVRRGHVASNPVERLERGELPKTSRREMRLLDSEELALLLESAEGVYRVLLATAAFTGPRLGELLGFTWRDVDFDRGRISVRCQLQGGERVEPKTPQAKREIVLMPSLALMLKEHKASSRHCADKDFVFTSLEGEPLTPSNARRRGLEKAAKRAGLDSEDLPKLCFHDLRHLYASLLIADGMDVVFVSRMLGHADPSITLSIYAHLWDAHRHGESLAEKLESGYGALVGKLMENRNGPQPPATASNRNAEVVDLQALRQ